MEFAMSSEKIVRVLILCTVVITTQFVVGCSTSAKFAPSAEPRPQLSGGTASVEDGEKLNRAVRSGDIELLRGLLEKGANPSSVDALGFSPLGTAIAVRSVPMTELLLSKGADPNFPRDKNSSPLLQAVDSGETRLVELLLTKGANVDGLYMGQPILNLAVKQGNIETVKLLLKSGLDPNSADFAGKSALFPALGKGLEWVQLLIEHGASPNIYNSTGRSPLMIAARMASPSLVKYLIRHGADVNHKDRDGWTALKESMVVGCGEITQILGKSAATK